MRFKKIISVLVLGTMVGGSAMALEGCIAETPVPAYGYSTPYYPYGPATVGPPVVYGDWDEHRAWHDRDWWVENRRPWVETHHHEWLAHNNVHHYRD